MKILVSNDDGYLAPGLAALVDALAGLGELTVVAPEQNHSGASNSLTLSRPLAIRKGSNGFWFVNGTPTDCVHLAVTGFLDFRPDLIVSGINDGANMGDDTIYSGTVAAAMEGYLLGIPAIAFSLSQKGYAHLDSAAHFARQVVARSVAMLISDLNTLTQIVAEGPGTKLSFPNVTTYHQPDNTNVEWRAGQQFNVDAGCELSFPALMTITGGPTTQRFTSASLVLRAQQQAALYFPVLDRITAASNQNSLSSTSKLVERSVSVRLSISRPMSDTSLSLAAAAMASGRSWVAIVFPVSESRADTCIVKVPGLSRKWNCSTPAAPAIRANAGALRWNDSLVSTVPRSSRTRTVTV